jgi:hypothetical protein
MRGRRLAFASNVAYNKKNLQKARFGRGEPKKEMQNG